MNNTIIKTKCSSCVHCPVCSLKGDYLKLMDALPVVNGPFDIIIDCTHYRIAYQTIRTDAANSINKAGNAIRGIATESPQEKFWYDVNVDPPAK